MIRLPKLSRSMTPDERELTESQAHLSMVRQNLANVTQELATVQEEMGAQKDDTAGLRRVQELRTRRDALMLRQQGLREDVRLAEGAVRTREQRALVQEIRAAHDALSAQAKELWARAEPALRAVAALYGEFRAMDLPLRELEWKVRECQDRFRIREESVVLTQVCRLPSGFLAPFEAVERGLQHIDAHREYMGDAPTEEEARRRQEAAWRATEHAARLAATQAREAKTGPVQTNDEDRAFRELPFDLRLAVRRGHRIVAQDAPAA